MAAWDDFMSKIAIKGLYKIFSANDPDEVIGLLKEGKSKKEIQERTGGVVAVADATQFPLPGQTNVIISTQFSPLNVRAYTCSARKR